MSHKYLWLDDVREPPGGYWTWVKNYEEFCKAAQTSFRPHTVSLDHDLADVHYEAYHLRARGFKAAAEKVEAREKSGLDVVKYMIEHEWLPPRVIIHSLNPNGRDNMVAALRAAGYRLSGHAEVKGACSASPILLR